MTDFSTDLRTRLIAQGVTATILVGPAAIAPSTGMFLSLQEYVGAPPLGTHNAGAAVAYERPSIQVIAHGEVLSETLALAKQALNASLLRNTQLGTTYYMQITARQSTPFPMGLDGKGRVRIAFNLDAIKRP